MCVTWIVVLLTSSASAVTLVWDENPNPSTTGYMVYQGTSSGVYTNVTDCGLTLTNTFTTVVGATNYFAVTSYNAAGLESNFSPELAYIAGQPQTVTVRFDHADVVDGPWTNLQTIITTRPGYWRVTISR